MRSMFTRVAAALSVAGMIGATTLVAAPAFACGDKHATPGKAVPADAAKVTIAVDGMHCGDCATNIHNALVAIAGVYDATVDHEKGQATIAYDKKAVTVEALTEAITKAGYKAGKATPQA